MKKVTMVEPTKGKEDPMKDLYDLTWKELLVETGKAWDEAYVLWKSGEITASEALGVFRALEDQRNAWTQFHANVGYGSYFQAYLML